MYLINRKRFILNNIEVLLKADLHPANIEASIQQQTFPVFARLFDSSAEAAIAALQDLRYEIPAADFRQLCQQNFSDLFRLKDRIALLQQEESVLLLNMEARDLYVLLGRMFNAVLAYLERTGIKGLSADELLPPGHLALRRDIMSSDCLILQARCKAHEVDQLFAALLINHFQAFIIQQQVTQQQLDYNEQLLSGLLSLLKSTKLLEADLQLMHKIVELNFNAQSGFVYCRDKILQALEDASNMDSRMLLLSWHHKVTQQTLPLPELALHPKYPSLKLLLLEFLQSEISYQQKLSPLSAPENTSVKVIKQSATANQKSGNGKFQLQFSQRVLAIWAQTLLNMELLQLGGTSQHRFIELLAEHFSTSGSERIAADNLRRRFKEKHVPACETLIGILEQMILSIKQEYIGIISPAKK